MTRDFKPYEPSSVVTINRPPSEVFAALLDTKRYGEWTEMVDMSFDTPGEPAVGSRGQFRLPRVRSREFLPIGSPSSNRTGL